MHRAVPQPFTSFDSLIRFFSDADEIVFQLCFKIDDQQIAFLCREARQMAHHFQMHFGTRTAADLARIYGVETTSERIGNGPDRLISLADCSLRPPKINLNLEAIDALARYGQSVAGVNEK